ncbi:methyl-accepting chemotaxis protein [Metasolibacillus meyeri]|uniref:Methyl-accepting chemotaxis protein n=1 Tax=Metasolibacillus meyeri TaxID=1071052 RepID=A0AAW9NSP8_9BACL|nr:methyl-accepting chemotaxis protein [Metasolibacillus meyeri]MEC1177218.1 methyl-accepting chemotaxis protein [Metasolibacillus meyeri]
MSIGKKLYISLGTLVVIIFGISLFSYLQITNVNNKYNELIDSRLEQVYLAADVQSRIGGQGAFLRQYVLAKGSDALSSLEKEQAAIATSLERLDEVVTGGEMQELLAQLVEANNNYSDAAARVIGLVDEGKVDSAIPILNIEVRKVHNNLSEAANAMLLYNKDRFADTQKQTGEQVQQVTVILTVISIVSIIVGILSVIAISRVVIMPLKQLAGAVDQIATGDLTVDDVTVKSKDEVATIATSFNLMKSSLRELISVANENAEQLSNISRELTTSTAQVSSTSTTVASSIEQISASTHGSSQIATDTSVAMDETAFGIQNIAESTQTVHNEAQNTQVVASKGLVTIADAKEQMQDIYSSTKLTTELISKLITHSEQIQSISNVITDITDQTNLLALNAAIEAARAGEHGKGFAVVADEVRKLAEQSKSSANLIVNLTAEILHETRNVEGAVAESLQRVETGVKVIEVAGDSFNQITGAVENMTMLIADASAVTEQISAATEEVSASVSELASNVNGVAGNTEQIALQIGDQVASIQEINAVSAELEIKAEELAKAIAKFKI